MKKNTIKYALVAAAIIAIVASTTTFGQIIPLSQHAKDNAQAPEFSPVIEVVDGDWVLTAPPQHDGQTPMSLGETTDPFEAPKLLPLPTQAILNGLAPDNSPVIDLNPQQDGWLLTPANSPIPGEDPMAIPLTLNPQQTELFVAPMTRQQFTNPTTTTITLVPEPATILLLALGTTIIRKKQKK